MKTIITIAPLGAWASKQDNPATPISPREIADDVVACAEAGAAIAHVHARDGDGKPSQDPGIYREITDRIRERSDIVVQLSIGTRGFGIDDALEPIKLRPEMASFPLRLLHPDEEDPLRDLEYMARRMADAGVRPEFDGSSVALLDAVSGLRERGCVAAPPCFGLVLGEPATARETADKVMTFSAAVPDDGHWWVAKGGRHQLLARTMAIGLGGHVRVGFEDSTLDFDGSRPARSNADLVERIADIAAKLGRDPATPAEARAMLALRNTPHTIARKVH